MARLVKGEGGKALGKRTTVPRSPAPRFDRIFRNCPIGVLRSVAAASDRSSSTTSGSYDMIAAFDTLKGGGEHRRIPNNIVSDLLSGTLSGK